MSLKSKDTKIDAAVHAAMFTLGLSVEDCPDTADLMNDAIRSLVENLIEDDNEE